MPDIVYDMPHWLLGALISLGTVVICLVAYALFRRLSAVEFSDDDRGVALSVLGVVATITSLLLAFSAVSVWESFGNAEEAVVEEGDTLAQLGRDLSVFGTPEAAEAREDLRAYVRLVVDEEWNLMRQGQASEAAWGAADELFRAVGRIEVTTGRQEALLPEVFARTNELIAHRRDRLQTAQAEVPGTLWIVVLAGTVLTMLTLFVLPPTAFNTSMVAGVAFGFGLVFFFIIAMDRPFAGKESISPDAFQSTLEHMDQWDKETAAER